MKRIISVSRRTDIPAFYGDWFMNRLSEGYAGYIHPYSGEKYVLSLAPDSVVCFVFWSKNFIPFTEKCSEIRHRGYNFYFNYTITGLPRCFEPHLPEKTELMDNLKKLSDAFSPDAINWRYDPVIISNKTDEEYHLCQFKKMASLLKGYVKRCFFSFLVFYKKISENLYNIEEDYKISPFDPSLDNKIRFISSLQEIAEENQITLYSCCDTSLVNDKINKARCIDGELIRELFPVRDFSFESGPTRKGCGCTKSYDIGVYDSCPHGCLYCYANTNPDIIYTVHRLHDPLSPFLGYSKEIAEKWIDDIKNEETNPGDLFQ